MGEVDNVIRQALKNGLKVILNVHHYNQFNVDPYNQTQRLDGIWAQILARFKNYPPELIFEYLNEPSFNNVGGTVNETENARSGGANRETFSQYQEFVNFMNQRNQSFVNMVRGMDGHKARWLVLGSSYFGNHVPFIPPKNPDGSNAIPNPAYAKLPNYDARSIMTLHYYEPFDFTHQRSIYAGNKPAFVGWGSNQILQTLFGDMWRIGNEYRPAADRGQGMPILIGEYGTTREDPEAGLGTPVSQRLEYANWVSDGARQNNLGVCYWDFASNGFGLYNTITNQWISTIVDEVVK